MLCGVSGNWTLQKPLPARLGMYAVRLILANDKAPSVTHEWSWWAIHVHSECSPQCCHLWNFPIAMIMKEMLGFLSVIVASFTQQTLPFIPPFGFCWGLQDVMGVSGWLSTPVFTLSKKFRNKNPRKSRPLLLPSFLIWLDGLEGKVARLTMKKNKDCLISLFLDVMCGQELLCLETAQNIRTQRWRYGKWQNTGKMWQYNLYLNSLTLI